MRTTLGWVLGVALISMSGCAQPPTGIQAAAEAMGSGGRNMNNIECGSENCGDPGRLRRVTSFEVTGNWPELEMTLA